MKLFFLALIIFALFFFGFGYYQEKKNPAGVGPGSVFYPIDRAIEWLEANVLTLNESQKIELRLSFMQERLDELQALEAIHQLTQDHVASVATQYDTLAGQVQKGLKKVPADVDPEKAQELFTKVQTLSAQQKETLKDILERTTGTSTQGMLDAVVQTATSAFERAQELIKNR
ncbi:MAG: DUF5667 domain-containing protein [Patescibacteria group bacterium]